jgi:4-hydroxyphenylpyruvate dioxygenase-like putative hemolysin
MALPYENATSGANALEEIGKILTRFGCARFGTMTDNEAGELLVQFTHLGTDVSVRASYRGYAAAWLKEHPHSARTRATKVQHERKAVEQAKISVCSILRDWLKSQITMIEIGILSFEGAFLGQIMLTNGKSVLDHATAAGLLQVEGGAA